MLPSSRPPSHSQARQAVFTQAAQAEGRHGESFPALTVFQNTVGAATGRSSKAGSSSRVGSSSRAASSKRSSSNSRGAKASKVGTEDGITEEGGEGEKDGAEGEGEEKKCVVM